MSDVIFFFVSSHVSSQHHVISLVKMKTVMQKWSVALIVNHSAITRYVTIITIHFLSVFYLYHAARFICMHFILYLKMLWEIDVHIFFYWFKHNFELHKKENIMWFCSSGLWLQIKVFSAFLSTVCVCGGASLGFTGALWDSLSR